MRCAASILVGLLFASGTVRADPLDQVTGTEDWDRAGPENPDLEWQDWYRARVAWRQAGRELRLQRRLSRRLAPLLQRARAPRRDELRRLLQDASAAGRQAAPTDLTQRSPRRGSRLSPAPGRRHATTPLSELEAEEDPLGFESGEVDDTDYSKVPVERLDDLGQAIDEEGDRELRRVSGEKRPSAPPKQRRR